MYLGELKAQFVTHLTKNGQLTDGFVKDYAWLPIWHNFATAHSFLDIPRLFCRSRTKAKRATKKL
jgi:hypothetical protein